MYFPDVHLPTDFSSMARSARSGKFMLAFTLPLALLVSAASLAGLLRPDLYNLETKDWLAQTRAQDAVNLFLVVPVLSIAALLAHRGERLAESIWGGALLYLLYTFILYCFFVHFNSLFLVYTSSLGLTAYALLYYIRISQRRTPVGIQSLQRRVVGIYFISVAIAFSFLWLNEIIPAVQTGIPPASLGLAGLVTNPVHVLDLSFFLPGLAIVGVLLLRNHRIGVQLAPVLLVFIILMDITIAVIFVAQASEDTAFSSFGPAVMSFMAMISIAALLWLQTKKKGG